MQGDGCAPDPLRRFSASDFFLTIAVTGEDLVKLYRAGVGQEEVAHAG